MFRSSLKVRRYNIDALHRSVFSPRRSIVSDISTRENSSDASYDEFLNQVRESKKKEKPAQKITVMTPGAKYTNLKPDPETKIGWSTSYDKVYRQPFAKDTMHLLSLLEACLTHKNFERAEKILNALYPLCCQSDDTGSFIQSLNTFLSVWSKNDTVSYRTLENFVHSIPQKYPDVVPNDKTEAIMFSKYLSLYEEENEEYIKKIRKWRSESPSKVKSVLSHIDVIGIDKLRMIMKNKEIERREIPAELQALFEQIRDVSSELDEIDPAENRTYFGDVNSLPPSLDKNEDDLLSVDSFGLKVIRHSLLGLAQKDSKLSTELLEKISNDTLISDSDEVSGCKDFFAIYKTLSSEDQIKFNASLEEYNQGRQRNIELRAINGAKEKWKHDAEEMQKRGDTSFSKRLNVQLWKWYSDFLPFIHEEVDRCKELLNTGNTPNMAGSSEDERKQNRDRIEYGPYISLVDPQKMAVITILELLKLNSTGGIHEGMRTARAVIAVGKAIEYEYRSEELMKLESTAFSSQTWKEIKKNSKKLNNLVASTKTAFRNQQIENSKITWTQEVRAKVGSVLVSLLLHVAKVPVTGVDPATGETVHGEQPAFYHGYQYQNGSRLGVLKIHNTLVSKLSDNNLISTVQPQLLPMLVKPRPWSSFNNGGYMYNQHLLLRTRESPETIAYLKAASGNGDLEKVYAGLNVLGNTSWAINKKVFEVIMKMWNTGEEFLDIPSSAKEAVLPTPPARDADPSVRRNWQIEMKKAANAFSAARSLRCDANYKLEIARAFIGEKIYFPHNVDFRGRAYPLSPHFNHLGNDMTRSLLQFWEGRELGEKGLNWLKIHLANLFGLDKRTFEDRIVFVDTHHQDILDSAKDPLGGQQWWKTSDKPWQALATIYELSEAYALEDPTKFVSHHPVHQDGTCNGLQHYAALGGDIEGATQVNLVPSEKPQDVYDFVAKLVQKKVDEDAANGNESALKIQKHITRKVVKQTVMTNVYGVTFIGATLQIQKQIGDKFDRSDTYLISRYLTSHVFACIRQLFHGAHLIQDWLGECAKKISKAVAVESDNKLSDKPAHMSSVIWTTPLGLPCVQPYRDVKKKQIFTNLQTVFISDPFTVTPVNGRKQVTAFPPNYIHSLDASHMLLSAIKCGEANLSFAAVHDSYWTHAADIDTMNEIIRNEFVKLHEVDLIAVLKDEFDQRYKGYYEAIQIPKKSPIAKQIIALRSKITKELGRAMTSSDELMFEKRRKELLNSDNPKKVQQGKEMETTISLLENVDLENVVAESHDDDSSSTTVGTTTMTVLAPLKFPDIPPKGDFDVSVVKNSPFFFS